jgi:PAS domain S-box-containing protein
MSATPVIDLPAEDRSTLLDRVLVSAFLENIPDFVYFKDRQSRFIAASRSLVRYLKCDSQEQLLHRTDFDFFSAAHARPAYEDEQDIIRTGQPIIGKLEKETWPDGRVTWVMTTKMPLRNEEGHIIGTYGISKDVTKTKEMEIELETAHKAVVEASRFAGMAEVATGVLHNVGNVLNSLNVSASVIGAGLRQSKADSLVRLVDMLKTRRGDLAVFLSQDPKGRRVPEFLSSLARHAVEERERLVDEVAALQRNIDHVKEIVSMQQTYATMIGVVEPLEPAALMEDALRMTAGSLARHEIGVERRFQAVPALMGERAKILQILVNFIRNAKFACEEGGATAKHIVLRVEAGDDGCVRLGVQDNGVGIPAENLTRIFQHGFTTRAHGHGFGLHSAANAAKEMKGRLLVHSEGRGQGATFTLELPIALPAAVHG